MIILIRILAPLIAITLIATLLVYLYRMWSDRRKRGKDYQVKKVLKLFRSRKVRARLAERNIHVVKVPDIGKASGGTPDEAEALERFEAELESE